MRLFLVFSPYILTQYATVFLTQLGLVGRIQTSRRQDICCSLSHYVVLGRSSDCLKSPTSETENMLSQKLTDTQRPNVKYVVRDWGVLLCPLSRGLVSAQIREPVWGTRDVMVGVSGLYCGHTLALLGSRTTHMF